jgi:transposase InsO family protein
MEFIVEIHSSSSDQHRWILTSTDYFTKWIEVIPTRSAYHRVIIGFLEDIMEIFGCPNKIIIDKVASFKVEPLIQFCEQFVISLIHSTPYYPQGNGLAESSNKILIKIIKRLLEDNKKSWDSKLKFSLWVDRVMTKRSLGVSPFHLVYGVEAIFSSQIALPVEKIFQDYQGEPDDMIRRMQQLVEV